MKTTYILSIDIKLYPKRHGTTINIRFIINKLTKTPCLSIVLI